MSTFWLETFDKLDTATSLFHMLIFNEQIIEKKSLYCPVLFRVGLVWYLTERVKLSVSGLQLLCF